MLYDTPLRKLHEGWAEARTAPAVATDASVHRPGAAVGHRLPGDPVEYITYGPPDETGLVLCEVPGTFGDVEAEYAAIRRGAGLLDAPHRGTLRLTGAERLDFLDRLLTQKVGDLAPGQARPAFVLDRKGRIDADLLVIETGDATWIDLDVHDAARTAGVLEAFLFAEDVTIADVTADHHRLAVHGRCGVEVVGRAAAGACGFTLETGAAQTVMIAGVETVVARRDQTGDVGVEIIVPRDGAAAVWEALLAVDGEIAGGRGRVRPIGWYAYNIARIETGSPLFNVDFGRTNLPHETGVLEDRVSFSKGCYPGQEIVARVQSRGKPKQALVGLVMSGDGLPIAGGQVLEPAEDGGLGEPIGTVTSSTISPMLGARPIAFAMVRSAFAETGTPVLVSAEGEMVGAEVGGLVFWVPPKEA